MISIINWQDYTKDSDIPIEEDLILQVEYFVGDGGPYLQIISGWDAGDDNFINGNEIVHDKVLRFARFPKSIIDN